MLDDDDDDPGGRPVGRPWSHDGCLRGPRHSSRTWKRPRRKRRSGDCGQVGRAVKLEFHGSSFLVASSWHLRRRARHLREDLRGDAGVSRACRVTYPSILPRAYRIGRPAVCCGVQCCRFVRVSRRSPNSTSPTRTTCRGRLREDPRSILVRHARFPRDMLATSSRERHVDASTMLRGNCFREIWALRRTNGRSVSQSTRGRRLHTTDYKVIDSARRLYFETDRSSLHFSPVGPSRFATTPAGRPLPVSGVPCRSVAVDRFTSSPWLIEEAEGNKCALCVLTRPVQWSSPALICRSRYIWVFSNRFRFQIRHWTIFARL